MATSRNYGTRRALLIGINNYKYSYINNLQGCVNDVLLMKDVLVANFAFSDENIKVLTDEHATSSAIKSAFDELVTNTEENDIVVFHYSGHGSQITDKEGDEPDGLDETILPFDTGRTHHGDENRDIKDDEIYDLIKRLNAKTPYVTLIFDSCHSGTMSRDIFGDTDRWVEPDNPEPDDPNYHLLPAPFDNTDIVSELKREQESEHDISSHSGWLPQGEGYVIIAGCRDEERSFESRIPGTDTYHGLLTYHLCQALKKVSPGTSHRSVFERAAAEVTLQKPSQQPQMEGKRDRELFGTAVIQTMRYTRVESRDGDEIVLKGGAAHGITKGSQWAIYSPETNEVTDNTPLLGLVEIQNVRAVKSTALILSGQSDNANAIEGGCRAVEHAHNYGTMQLPIKLDILDNNFAEEVSKLRQWIEESQLLNLTEDKEVAQWNVILAPPRTAISETTRAPQLGLLNNAMWVVIGSDGQLQPAHRADNLDSKYTVFENLEKSARYEMALNKIKNPSEGNALQNVLKVSFKRKNTSNEWVNADAEDQPLIYQEGELLGLEIKNVTDRLPTAKQKTVFISALNFGLTGSINLLHPIEGASEELRPGNKIEIGIRDDDQIPITIPANFPIEKGEGIDRIKLFITSHPADFSGFVQESWRNIKNARSQDSPIEQLMALALTNQTRDTLRGQSQPIEHWLTQTYDFTVRR